MAAKRKKQRRRIWTDVRQWLSGADDGARRRRVRWTLAVLAGLALLGGAGYGLWWLEERVLDTPESLAPPKIRLVDVPDNLRAVVTASLDPFVDAVWSSPQLCEDIAAALEFNPWVSKVERVQRYANRGVDVHCAYRLPFAMVQYGEAFYLVDEAGVHLPGRYSSNPEFMIVQGVQTPPPADGEAWDAPDLLAGLTVVKLIDDEPFARQITAVQVHNFHGRRDAREPHIVLATNRAGGQIAWGSAVGEEIEENTAEQKLALLRANYRRFGHVDAGRPRIDVSVHPDRITVRADGE